MGKPAMKVKRLELALIAGGIALLAVVFSKIGWGSTVAVLRQVWVAVPLLIGLSAVRLFLQTSAWRAALREEGAQKGCGELAGIRMASQCMGYLSVLGPAISEPMKIKLLGEDWKKSTTATLVDTGVYWFSS